jgi:hypothetical protein
MAKRKHDPGAEERLAALLWDLNALSDYLSERGRHTYELAQRFMEHARQDRDASTRAYDERQATMLGYQRHVWIEIAGLVNKLLVQYGNEPEPLYGTDPGDSPAADAKIAPLSPDSPDSPEEQSRLDEVDRQE